MTKSIYYFIAIIVFTTLIGCQKDDPVIPVFPPEPISINFEADQTTIFQNESVHFTDLSENAVAWKWYFEGGIPETSTEKNPIVTYPLEGTYDVKLVVENISGKDSLLKKEYITVSKLPVEDLSLKIWAHAVNDTVTAKRKKDLFAGLELDLNYSQYQNQIFVGHGLYDTINNLTFFQWLSSLNNHSDTHYWLDMKNLSEENADSIASLILNCVNHFGIKDNVIIESTAYLALKKIQTAGLAVLLWTWDIYLNQGDTATWKEWMQEKIDFLQPNGISGHVYSFYPVLVNHFPEMPIYYWNTPIGGSYEENMELTREICRIPNVKAVLVDYEEPIEVDPIKSPSFCRSKIQQ